MKKLFFAVFLCLFLRPAFVSALSFSINYDSSVLTQTNAAAITNAFATAAQAFSDTYTNAATVHLTVYWGPVGPFASGIGLGRSQFVLINSSYSQITNALRTHRASAADTNSVASLPASDPAGSAKWLVPYPEARVLGMVPVNDSTEDGEIGFATNVNYTFDPNNRSVPGNFDFIGVAQHELSEVLGRDTAQLNPSVGFVPYDLFRFTNSGARSLTIDSTTNAYFSVDNGVTALKFFYTNHLAGDIQDWKSSGVPDSFDAFVMSGHINPMSTVDITTLDVLGYNSPGLLEPPRLYGVETNGHFQVSFANSPGVTFTILATTNLALPEASWSVLGTATESPAGQFRFTDTTATNGVRFYRVRSP